MMVMKKKLVFKILFVKINSNEASSTCVYCYKLGHSKQYCPLKIVTQRDKLIKSVWIPKGASTCQSKITKMKWIPKGTRIVSTNT